MMAASIWLFDLAEAPTWRIVDVRYWGFSSDRWYLEFDRGASLPKQLSTLAHRLPEQLT